MLKKIRSLEEGEPCVEHDYTTEPDDGTEEFEELHQQPMLPPLKIPYNPWIAWGREQDAVFRVVWTSPLHFMVLN